MPLSFWIFLAVCVVSFFPVFRDHGRTWIEFKSSTGKLRRNLGTDLFVLWAVPVFTAVGTLITGFEATASNKENAALRKQAAQSLTIAAETMAQVEKLRADNLVLVAVGEDAKKSAAQATEAAEKAKTERVGVEIQVEQFRQTNYVLQTRVLELEGRLRPRNITDEQHARFVSSLKNTAKKPIWVVCASATEETRKLAQKVRQMLDEAGFEAGDQLPKGIYGSYGRGVIESPGMIIGASQDEHAFVVILISGEIRSQDQVPIQAHDLINAFGTAGISKAAKGVNGLAKDDVVVAVKSKPGI